MNFILKKAVFHFHWVHPVVSSECTSLFPSPFPDFWLISAKPKVSAIEFCSCSKSIFDSILILISKFASKLFRPSFVAIIFIRNSFWLILTASPHYRHYHLHPEHLIVHFRQALSFCGHVHVNILLWCED